MTGGTPRASVYTVVSTSVVKPRKQHPIFGRLHVKQWALLWFAILAGRRGLRWPRTHGATVDSSQDCLHRWTFAAAHAC
jgi:hypothetical protein